LRSLHRRERASSSAGALGCPRSGVSETLAPGSNDSDLRHPRHRPAMRVSERRQPISDGCKGSRSLLHRHPNECNVGGSPSESGSLRRGRPGRRHDSVFVRNRQSALVGRGARLPRRPGRPVPGRASSPARGPRPLRSARARPQRSVPRPPGMETHRGGTRWATHARAVCTRSCCCRDSPRLTDHHASRVTAGLRAGVMGRCSPAKWWISARRKARRIRTAAGPSP
jgi:hypothetical protein